MASTIRVKAEVSGDVAQVKSLVLHPMETGTRKDEETGDLVAAKYITQLTFTNNGKPVMVANFSTAVSRDPYFSFKFKGGKVGDTLKVTWIDSDGDTDEIETVLE
jgi:sulfur-oxidizing protein SoxZ